MELEKNLEQALRRQRPPGGFSGRLMERVAREGRNPRRTWWRAAAASITLVAALAGYTGFSIAERRRAESERAREEVLLALRIASEKVRYAQNEVRSIGTND